MSRMDERQMIMKNDLLEFTSQLNDQNENMKSLSIICQYQHNTVKNIQDNSKQEVDDTVKLHNNSIYRNLEKITKYFNSCMKNMVQ